VAHAQQTFFNKILDSSFNHLDVGVTLGTTGYGFDVATPVTEWARLRTGFSYVPKMEVPMTFGIQVGEDEAMSEAKFKNLSGYLTNFTGNEVKPEAEMIGKPRFWNWNFMIDVFPLKQNRHWHATAGFFLGPSRVAEAYNNTESMATLLSVNIYNRIYDKLHNEDGTLMTKKEMQRNQVKIVEIPGMDIGNDYDVLYTLGQKMHNNGRMGVHLGNYSHDIVKEVVDENGEVTQQTIHRKGESYMMDPDANSMVSATMTVNAFKPYIGVGYDGHLTKRYKDLYVGFDAGIMFWGGTPHLTTHDGTDLIHDVENIPGKVGDYVSAIESFKVFPMVNFRISYKLF
jgi:hypothetical protein